MAKNKIAAFLESIEPQERLKQLIDFSNLIEVDPHVPPTRYYRSGLEMVRMANVYYDEGNLEKAYCLYLKFMTLFLEKIRKHPDFSTVPSTMKAANQAKLREILPKAEKLKQRLLDIYKQDYDNYVKKLTQLAKEAEQRKRKSDEEKKEAQKPVPPKPEFVTAQIPGSIDGISYPDPNLTGSSVTLTPSAPEFPPSYDDENFLPSLPAFDRSKKPSGSGFDEKYDADTLRNVLVPSKVMTMFETLAQKNTNQNIETCGILAGKLEKNQLIITHMILPKQNGTPDSCTTTNEEEIFDYQDQHNLITIGWIHTHPTQTAFLSSVDLHTQCPYQLLMPEAIAIHWILYTYPKLWIAVYSQL
ncbi:STAM-binding protein-like isoform X2 [Anthonomus grandis grandis]|uniref:STAM-binding protein-like isoform X2 n=1 Tax=Anthonomus grandis grandis TaxID=2921223 RepID=UPI0021666574|nr:STAM-binding protein-like isoform X2 [Anthonomus grandis grandis]